MIGEVLRVTRIANDMTIKEVSQKSNLAVSYITELEKQKRKNPSIEYLSKICDVYGLKVSELLELDSYHNSIIGKKQQLEIYKSLLLQILKTYEEKKGKVL